MSYDVAEGSLSLRPWVVRAVGGATFVLLTTVLLNLVPRNMRTRCTSANSSSLALRRRGLCANRKRELASTNGAVVLAKTSFTVANLAIFLTKTLACSCSPYYPAVPLCPIFKTLNKVTNTTVTLIKLPVCYGKGGGVRSRSTARFIFTDSARHKNTTVNRMKLKVLNRLDVGIANNCRFGGRIFLNNKLNFGGCLFFSSTPGNTPSTLPICIGTHFALNSGHITPCIDADFNCSLTSSGMCANFRFNDEVEGVGDAGSDS